MALFPGEKLPSGPQLGLPAVPFDEEATNQKYASGEVRIVTEQARYPLPSIPIMLSGDSYELHPEYQRRRRWDVARKSKLIESFIMNVPVPPIFLYEDRYSHYEVMDGLQRLTTIDDFYKGKFALEALEQWPELNGLKCSSLPLQVRKGIDRRYLSSIILLQETAKTVEEAQRLKQLVFERINSGGAKLEPQEARNALYDGPLNRLCLELSRHPALCKMWGIPEPTEAELESGEESQELLECEAYRRMEDVELVLRFFAYRQLLEYDDRFSLRDYLDHFLKHGNTFSPQLIEQYSDLFRSTITLVGAVLGEKAFWLYRRREASSVTWSWRKSPTKVLYDPLMFEFSMRLDRAAELESKAQAIRDGLEAFYKNNYDDFEGRTTNRADMVRRNQLVGTFLDSFT